MIGKKLPVWNQIRILCCHPELASFADISSGEAVGMIGYKNKADYEKRADEDDLIASFDIRYTLIDQNNYTTHQFD